MVIKISKEVRRAMYEESENFNKEEKICKSTVKYKINPKYSLEWLMLKLNLQYFGHSLWRADSLEKTLILGKIEGRRRRRKQRIGRLDGITNSMDMSLNKLQEIVKNRGAWHAAVHGISKSQTWLSNRTTITTKQKPLYRGDEYNNWTEYFNRENKQQTTSSGKKYQLIQRQEREIIQSKGAKCLKKNKKERR